jgi:hypothetical protein
MEGAVPMLPPCLHGTNMDNFTLICISVTRMNHKHRGNLKLTMSADGP